MPNHLYIFGYSFTFNVRKSTPSGDHYVIKMMTFKFKKSCFKSRELMETQKGDQLTLPRMRLVRGDKGSQSSMSKGRKIMSSESLDNLKGANS